MPYPIFQALVARRLFRSRAAGATALAALAAGMLVTFVGGAWPSGGSGCSRSPTPTTGQRSRRPPDRWENR